MTELACVYKIDRNRTARVVRRDTLIFPHKIGFSQTVNGRPLRRDVKAVVITKCLSSQHQGSSHDFHVPSSCLRDLLTHACACCCLYLLALTSPTSNPGHAPSQRQRRLGGQILYSTSLFVHTALPVNKRPATHTTPNCPLTIERSPARDRCGRCNIPEISHR